MPENNAVLKALRVGNATDRTKAKLMAAENSRLKSDLSALKSRILSLENNLADAKSLSADLLQFIIAETDIDEGSWSKFLKLNKRAIFMLDEIQTQGTQRPVI